MVRRGILSTKQCVPQNFWDILRDVLSYENFVIVPPSGQTTAYKLNFVLRSVASALAIALYTISPNSSELSIIVTNFPVAEAR